MRVLLVALFAFAALAQSERTLTFDSNTDLRARMETATVVRSIVEPLGLEATSDGLIVRGPEDAVRAAEWLFTRLEKKSGRADENEALAGELIRIFPMKAGVTSQMMQEAATAVRVHTEAKRLFVHQPSRALVVRAAADKLEQAAWILRQIAGEGGEPSLRIPQSAEGVLRAFTLTLNARPMQELATVVRSITEVRRLMTLPSWGRMIVRGTADQVRAVEWLVPAIVNQNGARSFAFAGEQIRLFDVTRVKDRNAKAVEIRQATRIPAIFMMQEPPLLAARGSAEQMTAIEKLLAQ